MSTSHPLWFSTGVMAHDRIVAAHQARLECITEAINALGRLRSEYGYSIDALPEYVNDARLALMRAYHAELDRKPEPMPRDALVAERDALRAALAAIREVDAEPRINYRDRVQRMSRLAGAALAGGRT